MILQLNSGSFEETVISGVQSNNDANVKDETKYSRADWVNF